jgi:hypothetical protein
MGGNNQECTVGLGEIVIAILLFVGILLTLVGLLNIRQDVQDCLVECFLTTICQN